MKDLTIKNAQNYPPTTKLIVKSMKLILMEKKPHEHYECLLENILLKSNSDKRLNKQFQPTQKVDKLQTQKKATKT